MTETPRDPSLAAAETFIEADTRRKYSCALTGKAHKRRDLVELGALRPNLADRVQRDHPDLPAHAFISRSELQRYRRMYVEELLQEEHGEFSELDRQVAESLARQDTIAANIEDEFAEKRSFGQRLSDTIAEFGGSWAFLITFFIVLFGWMALNVALGSREAFDAYPFILLNLVLSCIAAVQAPIIMMSQRRQEQKDRLRALNDYRVNLKAELEIRHVHEKLDYLISRQFARLAAIQELQMDMMAERRGK